MTEHAALASPTAHDTFVQWMWRKRALYATLLCGVGLGLVASSALLLRARFVPAVADDSAWLAVVPFGWLHDSLALPVTWQIVIAPLVLWPIVLGCVLAFERVIFRLDPSDHTWTSFVWTLRSWPMGVLWLGMSLFLEVAVGYLFDYVGGIGAEVAAAFVGLLTLSVAWNARMLARTRAARWWSARWPGWRALATPLGVFVLVLIVFQALAPISLTGPSMAWLLVPAFVVIAMPITAFAALVWISRGRIPLRRALRLAAGRATAWMLLQGVRIVFLLVLLALWAAPTVLMLCLIAPQFETALRPWGSELPTAWMDLVDASRFVSAWWWMGVLSYAIWAQTVLDWFGKAATGRLFVQLGWVTDDSSEPAAPTPASHPDCDRSSTTPPTA
jgi:hypothetical protein